MNIIYLAWSSFIFGCVFCENNSTNNSSVFDYCSHPDCSIKNQHTVCIAANKINPRLYASGITMWMRYQLLLLHNRHRDNIAMGLEAGQPPATNMRKMYWDYELEMMAEMWARQCQKRHDECRNTIRFNVLQNMDVRPVVTRVTEAQLLADSVDAWFSGSRVLPPDYVFSFRQTNCSAPGGCNAHWYSAVAWSSTWRIGCSQAICTAKKPSCVSFRKRRGSPIDYEDSDIDNSTEISLSSSSENILRRTKYETSTRFANFDKFPTPSDMKWDEDSSDSPLHRGILKIRNSRERKRKETKFFAYTFCNYGPAGNIEGFPIYEGGTTCDNCPQGTQCSDRTYRGLCSLIGDPDSN